MNIFAIIANLINKVLSFSFFGNAASYIPSLPGTQPEQSPNKPSEPKNEKTEPINGRCLVSRPENPNPNATFFSTGSSAWRNQWEGLVIDGVNMYGRHGGTDFLGPQGTAVYAPFDMTIVNIGHYSDSGRYGDYIVANGNGLEYYSGHLQNLRVKIGQQLSCGDQIGEMNHLAHTHIQIKRNGTIIDPQSVLT